MAEQASRAPADINELRRIFQLPFDVPNSPPVVSARECLVIGLGGTGTAILRKLKETIQKVSPDPYGPGSRVQFLAIDTDPSTEADLGPLRVQDEFLFVRAPRVPDIPDDPIMTKWFPPRNSEAFKHLQKEYMEGAPGAGRVPLVSRAAVMNNSTEIFERIRAKWTLLSVDNEKLPYLFVIGALGGGTGRGSFQDVAIIARSAIRAARPSQKTHLFSMAVLLMPEAEATNHAQGDVWRENSYAALLELEKNLERDTENTYRTFQFTTSPTTSDQRIFTQVFLFDQVNGANSSVTYANSRTMASSFLYHLCLSELGSKYFSSVLDTQVVTRQLSSQHLGLVSRYSSFGLVDLEIPLDYALEYSLRRLCVSFSRTLYPNPKSQGEVGPSREPLRDDFEKQARTDGETFCGEELLKDINKHIERNDALSKKYIIPKMRTKRVAAEDVTSFVTARGELASGVSEAVSASLERLRQLCADRLARKMDSVAVNSPQCGLCFLEGVKGRLQGRRAVLLQDRDRLSKRLEDLKQIFPKKIKRLQEEAASGKFSQLIEALSPGWREEFAPSVNTIYLHLVQEKLHELAANAVIGSSGSPNTLFGFIDESSRKLRAFRDEQDESLKRKSEEERKGSAIQELKREDFVQHLKDKVLAIWTELRDARNCWRPLKEILWASEKTQQGFPPELEGFYRTVILGQYGESSESLRKTWLSDFDTAYFESLQGNLLKEQHLREFVWKRFRRLVEENSAVRDIIENGFESPYLERIAQHAETPFSLAAVFRDLAARSRPYIRAAETKLDNRTFPIMESYVVGGNSLDASRKFRGLLSSDIRLLDNSELALRSSNLRLTIANVYLGFFLTNIEYLPRWYTCYHKLDEQWRVLRHTDCRFANEKDPLTEVMGNRARN